MTIPRAATSAVVVLLLVTTALSGCIEGADDAVDPASTDAPDLAFIACEHPYPCGDGTEWPQDLEGPFDLLAPEPLPVPGHDGIELEAYVWLPDVPEGTEVPVVLHAQPYAGQCYVGVFCIPRGDDPSWLDNARLRSVAEAGYAVVNLNVRGTGTSGGCFEMGGPNEARDLATAVEWVAEQPWSNGRVAMTGISYMGTTPWLAANHNPPALKTIVPGGIVSNEYTFTYTPQGASPATAAAFNVPYTAGLALYPPMGAPSNLPGWAEVAPERACPDLAGMFAAYSADQFQDHRQETYWTDRQHVAGFPNITAAVLVYHGLRDNSGHAYQEDAVWDALEQAPKRMILGEWGHTIPDTELLESYPGGDSWSDVIVPWLDFWLKGVGEEPPRLGTVDYQTRQGTWRTTDAWPPTERSDEALYLDGGTLATTPPSTSSTFQATQPPTALTPYCDPAPTTAVFLTDPLDAPVTLAGNPLAYLQVESDQPGGIVAVDLYDLGPDARCVAGDLEGGTLLSRGAADLRFHEGNLQGTDFATNDPTPVRVDLINLAHTVEAGHRIAVVASGHGFGWHAAQPYTPTITLQGDGTDAGSHIVLPVVDGTLGGSPASVDYPPRPFAPRGSN